MNKDENQSSFLQRLLQAKLVMKPIFRFDVGRPHIREIGEWRIMGESGDGRVLLEHKATRVILSVCLN